MRGSCHLLRWPSRLARRAVKDGLGGEIYAFSELVDHVKLVLKLVASPVSASRPLLGLELAEVYFPTYLPNKLSLKITLRGTFRPFEIC